MSQYDFGDLESPLTGTALINTHLEPFRDALHSMHKGSSRPSYAVAGMMWVDDNTTPWVLYMFDGSDDISLGTINPTTNVFTPAGSATTWGGTAGGTANAQTITPSPALTAYAAGNFYHFIVATTNTAAAPTLNVSALGAKTIKCSVGGGKVNLPIGALQSGMIATVVYDGTDFLLLNVRPHNKSADIATATTVNLNSATGDYVLLTGTTQVDGFTLAEGVQKTCVCEGIFQLTDSSDDSPPGLIIPGGANVTTAAGDVFVVRGEANGTVRVISYTRADGTPLISGGGFLSDIKFFSSSGTWNKPTGLVKVIVELQGAGGEGENSGGTSGADGGSSSFGAHFSASGGQGGQSGTRTPGTGSSGDENWTGEAGTAISTGFPYGGAAPSLSLSPSVRTSGSAGENATTPGSGGAPNTASASVGGCGGGAARKEIAAASLGSSETVTIGAGGGPNHNGGDGGDGYCIVYEFT